MKIIYGDERDDERKNTKKNLVTTFIFEVFLLWPWAILLVFSPTAFPSGYHLGPIIMLLPLLSYPVLLIICGAASSRAFKHEQYDRAKLIVKLPMLIPAGSLVLFALIEYLWTSFA